MAKIPAGIFGAGRGKVAGTVLSESRTMNGKTGTIREYVIPADPKTTAQVTQRTRFKAAGLQATMWGANVYRRGWNNTLGLLAGYQALVSYIFTQIVWASTKYVWVAVVSPKTLGPVYDGNPVMAVAGASGKIKITWTTTLSGDYCAATDVFMIVICHGVTLNNLGPSYFGSFPAAAIRSAGQWESAAQFIPGDEYAVFVFCENYTGGEWRSSTMKCIKITAKV
jgi:hypothetical protein